MKLKVLLLIFTMSSFSIYAKEAEYTAEKLFKARDIFKRPATYESDEQAIMEMIEELSSGLNIKGVVLSPSNNYLIINERIFSEGESWNRLIIEKIFPDKLLLRYEDKVKELYIKQREETDE